MIKETVVKISCGIVCVLVVLSMIGGCGRKGPPHSPEHSPFPRTYPKPT
ncbi:MAG TPA: lipoprotein [Candidatus Nitrosotenuis sp.]|jgi:hypothetical protein|nr:lipoprotein [Candidatus Nitrosotenuis sp.]